MSVEPSEPQVQDFASSSDAPRQDSNCREGIYSRYYLYQQLYQQSSVGSIEGRPLLKKASQISRSTRPIVTDGSCAGESPPRSQQCE